MQAGEQPPQGGLSLTGCSAYGCPRQPQSSLCPCDIHSILRKTASTAEKSRNCCAVRVFTCRWHETKDGVTQWDGYGTYIQTSYRKIRAQATALRNQAWWTHVTTITPPLVSAGRIRASCVSRRALGTHVDIIIACLSVSAHLLLGGE